MQSPEMVPIQGKDLLASLSDQGEQAREREEERERERKKKREKEGEKEIIDGKQNKGKLIKFGRFALEQNRK